MSARLFFLPILTSITFLTASSHGAAQTDRHGDPLPAGAIGRLGTTRLRHGASVWDMAFLPDGKTLASLDRGLPAMRLWDRGTGKEKSSHRLGLDFSGSGTFSPNRQLVACAGGGELGVYELVSGKRLLRLVLPPWQRCCFSADSRSLLVASTDGIDHWEIATGKKRQALEMVRPRESADFSNLIAAADGKLLAAWNRAGGSAYVWDLPSGKILYDFAVEKGAVLTFAPDRQTLATVSTEGSSVVIRASATGKRLHALYGDEKAYHLAFSPVGSTLAIACAKNWIRLWDVRQDKETGAFLGSPSLGRLSAVFVRRPNSGHGKPGHQLHTGLATSCRPGSGPARSGYRVGLQ